MINTHTFKKAAALFLTSFAVLTLCVGSTVAQIKPLTLGEVLTGLQSKSGGFSLSEKNTFITQSIMQRGVTFRLTTGIRSELTQVGASSNLLRAIAIKAPKLVSTAVPTSARVAKPRAKVDKYWMVENVNRAGIKGFEIHSSLNIYNLKDVDSQLTVRLRNGGNYLLSSRNSYRNKLGHLARFRKIKPKYTVTVFNDMSFFIPYKEINLPAGSHNLKAELALIRSGRLLQNMDSHPFVLKLPKSTTYKSKVKFNRLWIDYNQTVGGKLGMTVHTSFNISNFKSGNGRIALLFSKRNGEKLTTSNPKYKNLSGQVTIYRKFSPKFPSTVFNNLAVFVPYEAFALDRGRHNLSVRAELIYSDGTVISALTNKPFSFQR